MSKKGRTWRRRDNKHKEATVLPFSLTHKQEYINLFRWAKQNGAVFNKMKPAIFPSTGRGLMATGNIKCGDLLVSVPKQLLVADQYLRGVHFSHENTSNLSTMDLLCLFLILEKWIGEKSLWAPYIMMLPSQFNIPAYFDAELHYCPEFIVEYGQMQLRIIRNCFLSLKNFVSKSSILSDRKLTFDDVRWAWSVINTRCVYLDKMSDLCGQEGISCCLAPFLDLLNHSCSVEVDAGFSEVEGCYNIYTKTRFKKGEQVFINYGPHNNRKLIAEYGFTLPNNIHNCIKIAPKLVRRIVREYFGVGISKHKRDVITKYRLEDAYFCTRSGLSWSLETALRLFALDDSTILAAHFNVESFKHTTEICDTSAKISSKILKHILGDYDRDLSKISASFDEKRDCCLSERLQMLVELLEEEKFVVQSILSSLSNM